MKSFDAIFAVADFSPCAPSRSGLSVPGQKSTGHVEIGDMWNHHGCVCITLNTRMCTHLHVCIHTDQSYIAKLKIKNILSQSYIIFDILFNVVFFFTIVFSLSQCLIKSFLTLHNLVQPNIVSHDLCIHIQMTPTYQAHVTFTSRSSTSRFPARLISSQQISPLPTLPTLLTSCHVFNSSHLFSPPLN